MRAGLRLAARAAARATAAHVPPVAVRIWHAAAPSGRPPHTTAARALRDVPPFDGVPPADGTHDWMESPSDSEEVE